MPVERELTAPRDGFVSSMGWLTAFVSDSTMALVEDDALLGPRQLDMGHSGSKEPLQVAPEGIQ